MTVINGALKDGEVGDSGMRTQPMLVKGAERVEAPKAVTRILFRGGECFCAIHFVPFLHFLFHLFLPFSSLFSSPLAEGFGRAR